MKSLLLFKASLLAILLSATSMAGDYVVVVSAKSPVDKLTAAQVNQIFLGKTETFPNGSSAVPVDQVEGSAVRADFDSKALGKSVIQVKAYWSKLVFTGKEHAPREVASSGEMKNLVSSNQSYVGYIDKASVDSSVKVVYQEY